LLNDIAVERLPSSNEARRLDAVWKRPCAALYVQVDVAQALAARAAAARTALLLRETNPITVAVMLRNASLARAAAADDDDGGGGGGHSSFTPLAASELPLARGTLVAIDCEFVALAHEQTKLDRSGREVVVKPARHTLARVSVVRAQGPLAGVPLLDSYIVPAEPVVDYLTRYSGLVPGDLDPAVSRHHVTNIKDASLKLRYLVDAGCLLVGHGLSKDFEMINIVVPAAQIVDTVEIWYVPGERRVSLRFLAYALLGIAIQARVHDSVEDARTALALFRKYQVLHAAGVFREALTSLYREGHRLGWAVPGEHAVGELHAESYGAPRAMSGGARA
jgi:PAB-dependent poly(A)-specific ribonuclease subunit 2